MKKILITGGTGTIGQHLITKLSDSANENIEICILTRSPKSDNEYKWDIKKGEIDLDVLDATHIVHLAGAGVADERWTEHRKRVILESRTESTKLLYDQFKDSKHLQAFVSASAIGYYGFGDSEETFKEDSKPGDDFLAEVTKAWENEVFQFEKKGFRTAAIRIGIVLSKEGGALPKITEPIKFCVGAPLGSGKQMMSWVHVDDLVSIFEHVLKDEKVKGAFNAVAPNPVSNKAFTKLAAQAMNKPLILPNVPSFVLKIMLGEMSEMVLKGSKVSSDKIENTGFRFEHKKLETALEDLLK
ncbi:MAG: TIGR01777 family oxidoreductase [Bacteroidota bacterium]